MARSDDRARHFFTYPFLLAHRDVPMTDYRGHRDNTAEKNR
jgi:hypothetical protein